MTARPDLPARGGALDALRFFASAFIVLYHFQDKAPVRFSDLHPGLDRPYLATDLFLMLSGYVLARAYGSRLAGGSLRPGPFLLRRVARVWPAHALVLAAMAWLVVGAGLAGISLNSAEGFRWSELPGHLLLVQAWGLGVDQGWNFPTWSLSGLVVCYAVLPFAWPAVARLRPLAALALGVGLVLAADLAARAVGMNFYALPQSIGVLRALPLFALGACLARVTAPEALTAGRARLLWIAAGGLAVGLQMLVRADLVTILLIAAVIFAAGARSAARPSSLIARGAELSFALYITHALVGMVWFHALRIALPVESLPAGVQWALWASGLPVAVACAWAFHRFVDAPVQAAIAQRLFGRREPRPAASPATV